MKCWICGQDGATTREHFIKKSDLKDIFGTPTQSKPHFLNAWRPTLSGNEKPTSIKRNTPVKTLRTDELTYDAKLCPKCNNEITQPHDKSWEKLSAYLRKRIPPIQPGTIIRLHRVFGQAPQKSMLNVHLFFVKQFLGIIIDGNIPILPDSFSNAILTNRPHPNIYLVFFCRPHSANEKTVVLRTEVNAANRGGQTIASVYDYQLGLITVRVVYSADPLMVSGIQGVYHPSNGSRCIEIVSSEQANHVA